MRTSRAFSLLEIVVGLALLLMAAGAIGWKIHGFVEKKRFATDLERLKSRVITLHRMAINTQSDWEGTFERDGKNWAFHAACLDSSRAPIYSPIELSVSEVIFDGESREAFTMAFYSSGEILPRGKLRFRSSRDPKTVEWDLPAIFGNLEGDGIRELGPVHPDEA
jgi:hypothetical protein